MEGNMHFRLSNTELGKKVVLGCVIPPLAAGASSRNLGQPFLAISVHTLKLDNAHWGNLIRPSVVAITGYDGNPRRHPRI